MNSEKLYQGMSQLVNQFPLEVRLKRVLRDFGLGVLVSGQCGLEGIAKALRPRGKEESQYRRLQRFLGNEQVEMATLQSVWAQQVIETMDSKEITLMVDETALSNHVKVMVMGVWSDGGCVPVAWRSYQSEQYPAEGQVELICQLLQRVLERLPIPTHLRLLADRGIGTSPELVQRVQALGVAVLFRVQGTTRFRDAHGNGHALRDLGLKAHCWQSAGEVFKNAGWLPAHAMVAWGKQYEHPWCLVSSQPLSPATYSLRFDQEVSFRDLKSDGFQWQRSHVWLPDHTDRLLLVLALVYWLVLAIGQRLPRSSRGRASRYSAFRLGRDFINNLFHPTIAPLLPFPPPRFLSSVVQ